MPRQWERRAAIGATLLAAMVPVLLLTLASLGVQAPKSVLQGALALEAVIVVFAVLLIVLPSRAWRFGRPYSEALFALHMPSVTVRPLTLHERGPDIDALRVEIGIKNSSEAVVMYHVESVELEIQGQSAPNEFQTRGGRIARGTDTYFYCPLIVGVDPAAMFLTGNFRWTALYGIAGEAFDVRWVRTVTINVSKFAGGAWRTDMFDKTPETHEVIKPIRPRTLIAT
jgi:hypothetical protein